MRSIATVLIAVLTLGGCGTIGDITGWGQMIDAPKPFQGKHRNEAILQGVTRAGSVHVLPIGNMPPDVSAQLATAVKLAGHEQEIPIVTKGAAAAAHRLNGNVSLEGTPERAVMTVRWLFIGPDGLTKDEFSVSRDVAGFDPNASGTAPWHSLPEATIQAIAAETATKLRKAVDRIQGLGEGALDGQRKIIVLPVDGAPGDGPMALARSLKYLLTEDGLNVETRLSPEGRDDIPENALVIAGDAELVDLSPEVQGIAMRWRVLDDKGQEIGVIDQKNQIEKGSLDKHWGTAAIYAAMGARDGLMDLLTRGPSPKSR